MTSIPETETQSGVSPGIRIQLRMAPATGMRNFHMLSSETFTPGLCKSVYQMAKAAADKKLSHARETNYSGATAFNPYPSRGIEIKMSPAPPKNKEEELSTTGEICCPCFDISTFAHPEKKLLANKREAPSKLMATPDGK